jgi:SAM-dependent methyltransferase
MVELTRSRGVEAVVGDAQDLPFRNAIFDCAIAAWMLYHVGDLHQTLRELRRVLRPGGRLVAATSSQRNLGELWQLVGRIGAPAGSFSAENAEGALLRHFTTVERRDVRGTVSFADRAAAHRHMAACPVDSELADRLPFFDGPLATTRHVTVFVCEP